ncbi:MAG TPA: sulfatase-like hydrolase/transferase [Paludibacteraceae bacterium]|nr:sulfatase-like hydrolase/transferase [Paludibacteraceae bacterium]
MKYFFKNILYLASVHVTALIFFMMFRCILFFLQSDAAFAADGGRDGWLIFQAFLMGLRFDNVISCYILLLPILVVGITACIPFKKKYLNKGIYLFFCILYSISFIIAAGDIPYFQQFFKHANASIWNWLDEPSFVFGMAFKESSYVIYIILFVVVNILFCWLIRKFQKIIVNEEAPSPIVWKNLIISIGLTLVTLALCFLGVRGRTGQKSPIRIGTAYFCNDPFLNQLGLNPVFVLMRTSMDMNKEEKFKIHFMDENEAVRKTQSFLNITVDSTAQSPIERVCVGCEKANKKNVVVIMMESMASHFISDTTLTPFLNELIKKSTYFPNTYSAGIHTMNGVFGTLFSYPALMNQHPFKTSDILTFNSWPRTMEQNGYSTYYFSTHDEQFDNIGGYLSANHIQKIIAEKDYPAEEVKSNLDVPDNYMFQVSINVLNEAAKSGKPFFSAFLTASNHAPHIIPEYFHPKSVLKHFQVIEFADYSLRNFFALASKEPWFKNTIFVLLGDHGSSLDEYDFSLAYHHTPLIFYDPSNETPRVINSLAGQIDAFPTTMGMLGLSYINNTFGIDLMKEKRDMMFFASDDAYCCIDSSFYYVCRSEGAETLYPYKEKGKEKENVIAAHAEHAKKMQDYVKCMMQTAQYMINNKKVFINKLNGDDKNEKE